MSRLLSALLVAAAAAGASAQIARVALPYELGALEPWIDAQTMQFHYGSHYATYVNNTNKAIASDGARLASRTDLSAIVAALPANLSSELGRTLRNQGGGAWNHALFFKHLAPNTSADASTRAISPQLSAAIKQAFGSVEAMQAAVNEAATKVFGSGWAWLCVKPGGALAVTSTPNQDNPLMNLPGASRCTPVLGIDVWEHAYYLKHGPKRAAWLDAFWQVVNWRQVSANFKAAREGKVSALVA